MFRLVLTLASRAVPSGLVRLGACAVLTPLLGLRRWLGHLVRHRERGGDSPVTHGENAAQTRHGRFRHPGRDPWATMKYGASLAALNSFNSSHQGCCLQRRPRPTLAPDRQMGLYSLKLNHLLGSGWSRTVARKSVSCPLRTAFTEGIYPTAARVWGRGFLGRRPSDQLEAMRTSGLGTVQQAPSSSMKTTHIRWDSGP